MFEDRETLWVIHISNDRGTPLRAKNEGFVCIGWTRLGDLSQYPHRIAMRSAMESAYPNWSNGKINSSHGQPFRFAHKMSVGDPIVFPVPWSREVMVGRITGDYRFASEDTDLVQKDYCNVRPVQWLEAVPRTTFSQAALHSFGAALSVSTSNDHLEELTAVLTGEQPTPDEQPENVIDTLEEISESEENETGDTGLYDQATTETTDYLLRSWQRTGAAFEHVVAAVLEAIGYTAAVTQASQDHGIDVIAHPDPLGLKQPFVKVQAKSGTSSIGEPVVNQLKGSLAPGEKGIIVSLGTFTKQAQNAARSSPDLVLIDGERFVELFLEHYDQLTPAWRLKFPLDRVYVPRQ